MKAFLPARIHCAGNLFIEAVQTALSALQDPMRTGAFHRMVIPLSSEDWCYALVLIEEPKHVADRQSVVALIAFLRRISRSVALVLLMRSDAEHEFNKHRLHREIFGERICHLPAQAYANQVELLAQCDLRPDRLAGRPGGGDRRSRSLSGRRHSWRIRPAGTGSNSHDRAVRLTAAAWATWPFSDDSDLPDRRDGLAGARIAEHLVRVAEASEAATIHLVTKGYRELVHISTPLTPPV